ncbi:hypothetical protein [Brevibacillus reuszeri]|uniref:hypothetical protein n=1 Tax=Brevibacillus reuszeri TaxID=54915 RepID=UPI0013DF91A8|nr:hypothetical protein [Brevibacillus reuszeri]
MIGPLAMEEIKGDEQFRDITKDVVNAINSLLENINNEEAAEIVQEIKKNQSSLLR